MTDNGDQNHGSLRRKSRNPQRSRHRNIAERFLESNEAPEIHGIVSAAKPAHNDHAYLNTSHTVLPLSSSGSFVGTQMNLRKNRRNMDHLYMAKETAETLPEPPKKKRKNTVKKFTTAKRSAAYKVVDRNTDHLYNAATTSLKTDVKKLVKTVKVNKYNNRDTDHLYNIRNSTAAPVLSSASDHTQSSLVESGESTISSADKRVIDKDHMYQHNTRKARNKVDGRGGAVKKDKVLLDKSFLEKKMRRRQTPYLKQKTLSQNKMLKNCKYHGKSRYQNITPADKLAEPSEIPEDFPRDHDYSSSSTAVKETGTSDAGKNNIFALQAQENSPTHSDFSDQICDDSRRTGIFHYDHMYVHTDHTEGDVFGEPEMQSGVECSPTEGYRQEHSYANSEETRYDACVNCSELVQQLIGTINQQKNCIEDLTKQLLAANAKNKQLSLLISSKPVAGGKRAGSVYTECEIENG